MQEEALWKKQRSPRDLEAMGAASIFCDSRAEVEIHVDYPKAGRTSGEFLDNSPTVSRVRLTAG